MIEHCKSERGYTTTGRIVALVLVSLINVWAKDYRSVNADVWNNEGEQTRPSAGLGNADVSFSPEWQKHHHEQWGRLYEAKDVKVCCRSTSLSSLT